MNSGNFQDALSLLTKSETAGEFNDLNLLSCHLMQSSLYTRLGNYQEGYRCGENAYNESKKLDKKLKKIDALTKMGYPLVWLGDYKKASESIKEAEEIINSYSESDMLEIEQRKGDLNFVKSHLSFFQGDIHQALEYAKESLEIRKKYDNKLEVAESLNSVAFSYGMLKKNLDTALEYAKRCQVLAKQINHQQIIHFNYMNLGIIYTNKGELDKGLENQKKALKYFEQINDVQWMVGTINNIGIIYIHLGEYDKAVDFFTRSLKLAEKMDNAWFIANSIVNAIEVFKLKGDMKSANEYLERLKELNEENDNRWIEMTYLSSKAALLKQKPRIQNRAEAERIYKDIVQREILPNLDINIDALVNLSELLIDELSFNNDITILDDLNKYIKMLLDIAKKTNSYWVLSETYVLQAKLALITLDLKGARRLLTQAQEIADKQGMHRLAAKISLEHDELLKKITIWRQLKKSESSLSERIKLTNVAEQMKNMIQKRRDNLPNIIEENPIMILIISEGGIPTFSKIFAESFIVEDDLISSFLAAFHTFSGELFSEGLERASFGDYTLIMKPLLDFLICYVYIGQSYSAQKRIQKFIDYLAKNEEILSKFNEFKKTNRMVRPENLPILNSLINEIFSKQN